MIEIIVNGARRTVESAPDTPLLWVPRDELGLTGTRFGCGAGLCGCCAVHVDGAAMRSCSIAVGDVASRNITTIEHARRSRMPRRRPLPGPVQLARMAAYCPGDLAGLRERPAESASASSTSAVDWSGEGRSVEGADPRDEAASRAASNPTIANDHAGAIPIAPVNRGGRSR